MQRIEAGKAQVPKVSKAGFTPILHNSSLLPVHPNVKLVLPPGGSLTFTEVWTWLDSTLAE